MAPAKKILSCETQLVEGDKPSDVVAESTSKNPEESQEGGDKNDAASKPSHKRTFSKTDDPDQPVADGSSVPPSSKKAKSDVPDTLSAPNSENELESSSGDLDEEDLVTLTPDGPNVFYGYTDALFDLFEAGGNNDGFWPKSKIMHAYGALGENEDIGSIMMACVSITCDPENLEPPEAKALGVPFKAEDGLWFEVTVTRHLPAEAPKKLRVDLASGFFDPRSGVDGGKSLGEWWISDISAAEGESAEAITTMVSHMF